MTTAIHGAGAYPHLVQPFTRDGFGQVISAYRSAQLIDALDCLIRGNWSEPGGAELVRDNHDAFEELPEECYGEELDHLARWLGDCGRAL